MHPISSTTLAPLLRPRRGKAWLALLALVTALAFVSLVSTALTHVHTSAQEAQECSLCSVVSDKIGSGQAAPALLVTSFVLLYAQLRVPMCRAVSHANFPALPPGCGPPSRH